MSNTDFVAEVIRISDPNTLARVLANETLSDVVGVHRTVLRARLGSDYPRDEEAAIESLRDHLVAHPQVVR